MVQHPEFLTYGYIYVVYNYWASTTSYRERVVRFTFANNTLQNPLTLIDNIAGSTAHNGSRLWISDDPSPYLFITTGDAANSRLAQDTNSLNGKILRLSLDGSIPPDNPIAGNPLWSMGHRNPQGFVVVNGIMYASEHGPNIEDEINIIEKGRNFGWPNTNGPCDGIEVTFCSTFNVKQPIWSSGGNTVAACGLEYYDSDLIPQWKNSLLLATLKNARLYQLKLSDDKLAVVSVSEFFRNSWGRLRDLCVSPSGRVYLCTSNGNTTDRLIEISFPE
jgi:glucose/arabinose dehydrogenase